jgi:aquaporin Z
MDSVNSGEVTAMVNGSGASAKYAVEAIGTFCLVSTVGVAICSASPFASLGIGVVLMAMIYTSGHLSGGHYNPAVTLAVLLRRRIGLRVAATYWFVQLGAGLLGAVVVREIVHPAQIATATTMMLSGHILAIAFLAEVLFTFVLSYVVLDVAANRSDPPDSVSDLAIGVTVIAGAFALAAVSDGAFDPAVPIGAVLTGMFAWSTVSLFLVTQIIAGATAGVAFLTLGSEDP